MHHLRKNLSVLGSGVTMQARPFFFIINLILLSLVPQQALGFVVADATPYLNLIGNPFRNRLPYAQNAYARNVWDMQVFDNRLYLGHGNSNNEPPVPNAGPVEIWYYDAEQRQFGYDYVLPEEQIDHFIVIDDVMYVPGHDPRNTEGRIYFLKQGGSWESSNPIRGSLHVYDFYSFQGTWFAALGVGQPTSQVIATSQDEGATWQLSTLPVPMLDMFQPSIYRAWEFFEVDGDLLVSVLPSWRYMARQDDSGNLIINTYDPLSSAVYRLISHINGQIEFEAVNTDFFAGLSTPEIDYSEGRIVHPIRFVDWLVYIGARTLTDHNWTSFGLFSSDDSYQIQVYTFEPGEVPYDLLVEDNTAYVLLTSLVSDGRNRTRVMATCDLVTWREVLQFEAEGYSRSFALYLRNFYFGQATDITTHSDAAGNILEVENSYFQLGC
jgi:hypothetical protein